MKAEELRIGNWVTRRKNEIGQVTSIIDGMFVNFGEHHDTISSIKPIPLTEEWLLKFGFENGNQETVNNDLWDRHWIGDFEISKIDNGFSLELTPFYTTIQYVHQLQNLYYALTGKELICQ